MNDDVRLFRAAALVTIVSVLARLALAAYLPLFPDETYYWEWSRNLANGYFDHPPAIAYLIAAGTTLGAAFGAEPGPFAVRFFPVLAGGAASWFSVLIARTLGGARAALTAALVFAVMPLAATGLVLATPDAPLLAASAAALYFVLLALRAEPSSAQSLGNWARAGVLLGLAFTSKYTSILLPLTVLIAIALRPSLRRRFREPGPYVACMIATLVFLPVLYWNATHEWISFRFQLEHGLGTTRGSAIKRELDLVGGQLGLVSPILFVLAAGAVWRSLRRAAPDDRFALAVVATGSWVFFVYSAMKKSVEANWPAPSYVPAIALLASLAASPIREQWVRRGLWLAAVLVGVVYLHAIVPVLPLAARKDPIARSAGWDGLAVRVEAARVALGPRTKVGADRYQDVSELAFHLPGRPRVYCMCLSGRRNQYDLWPSFAANAQLEDNLVLALDDTPEVHGTAEKLRAYFGGVERGELVPILRGADTVGVRRLWLLTRYRGGWPAR